MAINLCQFLCVPEIHTPLAPFLHFQSSAQLGTEKKKKAAVFGNIFNTHPYVKTWSCFFFVFVLVLAGFCFCMFVCWLVPHHQSGIFHCGIKKEGRRQSDSQFSLCIKITWGTFKKPLIKIHIHTCWSNWSNVELTRQYFLEGTPRYYKKSCS